MPTEISKMNKKSSIGNSDAIKISKTAKRRKKKNISNALPCFR